MTTSQGKTKPRGGRILTVILCYWVMGTLLGTWGARSLGSGVNWVGTLCGIILVFCILTWKTSRPLWQRALVIPMGVLFVVIAGGPLVRWLMGIVATGYADPMIERGTLVAASSPFVTWVLMQSRVFVRDVQDA
jgi:hypothetical protein